MSPEKQRIAIAEACGWKWHAPEGGISKYWHDPSGKIKPDDCIPDYLNNLNDMHEAEKTLSREQLVDYCAFRLRFVTKQGCADDYAIICATAKQRAEAFLRAIGKWEGGE